MNQKLKSEIEEASIEHEITYIDSTHQQVFIAGGTFMYEKMQERERKLVLALKKCTNVIVTYGCSKCSTIKQFSVEAVEATKALAELEDEK